ncbi:hypothetical protein [Actinomadura sp. 6N118]|uniref:hypothetical protein n=1 Tax=Actinomadura sp. 6N118 TaxID=3375151 RepID=UPI00378D9B03
MTALLTGPGEITELHMEADPGQVITYDMDRLLSALDITDPTRVSVEVLGRRAIITVYPENPVADVRVVTREDLIMDRNGRIVVGRYHHGRPVKRRLFDPSTGSAQRFCLFGTTGAGKSRALQIELIAEKVNGIVSFVCDLKNGQSVPEARGNVDWFGDSQAEAILMLLVAVAVANERMVRYSAMGRTAFVLGDPDPLLHVRIEEANRLLEKGAPYREIAAYLVKELGRTGRSVGVGVGLSAQASHLEELGGSDTLRAMIKEGEVTLLRWSSSMMRQLVADGLLPSGEQLMPIPPSLRERKLVSQFDAHDGDDEDGPGTEGMAYVLSSAHPTSLMRHHRIGSIKPLRGLDPEILALYGPEEPARLEVASRHVGGMAYELRDDRDAIRALCAQVPTDQERAQAARDGESTDPSGGAVPGWSTGGGAVNVPAPDTEPAVPKTLEDRIQAVLEAADHLLTAEEILSAVNAAGATVKLGSVRNALSGMVDDGDAERPGRGRYAAPGRTFDTTASPADGAQEEAPAADGQDEAADTVPGGSNVDGSAGGARGGNATDPPPSRPRGHKKKTTNRSHVHNPDQGDTDR